VVLTSRTLWLLIIALALSFCVFLGCGDDDDDDDSSTADDDDEVGDDDSADDDDDDNADDDDDDNNDTGDDDDDDDNDDNDDDDTTIDCNHSTGGVLESGEVHLIDIPEGLAAYVTFSGYDIVINGGAADDLDIVISYLASQGVQTVEEIVLASVADEDIGELEDILDTFGANLVRKGPAVGTGPAYASLMSKIEDLGLPVEIHSAGDGIDWGLSAPARVLSPPDPIPPSFTDKDKGLVIQIAIGATEILLAGSAGFEAERYMIDTWGKDLCSEVLVVGDHGSDQATGPYWPYWVEPEAALIVAAFRNPHGYPDDDVVNRLTAMGVDIHITKDDGQMGVSSNGYVYEVLCGG
jgi:competence protein ComEC